MITVDSGMHLRTAKNQRAWHQHSWSWALHSRILRRNNPFTTVGISSFCVLMAMNKHTHTHFVRNKCYTNIPKKYYITWLEHSYCDNYYSKDKRNIFKKHINLVILKMFKIKYLGIIYNFIIYLISIRFAVILCGDTGYPDFLSSSYPRIQVPQTLLFLWPSSSNIPPCPEVRTPNFSSISSGK